MQIVMVKLADIKPYKNNAKKHSKEQIQKVADSIKRFGFIQPLVLDKNNEIIIGHCRQLSGELLKLDEVPCVMADNLSEQEVQALRLADNKLNESGWDMDLAIPELRLLTPDLFDLTGFDESDLLGQDLEEAPEIKFTEELLEEHNYVVLYFDNDVDWLQAQSILGLKTVKALDSKEGFEKRGIGRVIKGVEAIEKIAKQSQMI